MRQETSLTPSEIEILRVSDKDPDQFTDYFFRPHGEDKGWRFDENFTPEGAWQKTVHVAEQRDITVIGGFGTGKTVGVGMSATVWASVTRDFKFLNVAPKAWQAKLMYDAILTNARNTRFEDLIWEKPRKPHPKIVIRYKIGKVIYESSLEFMSADKDATGILSWEGDWLHIDEAGLLDNLEEVIINAGSRLRGAVRGRSRLGRFSMASNSWDNFYLWYYYDQAAGDPENFLSIVVSSRHNKNITPQQLARMLARIPIDERPRYIEGLRPEGKGWYYSKDKIYECEDSMAGAIIEAQAAKEVPGFTYEKLYGAGVIHFKIPARPGRLYMVFGDPGTGAAPQRNAPVLMVWDVTSFPMRPATLMAFWWGNGNGRISPWVEKMFDFIKEYHPIYVGVDATGPQKNMNYLINEHLFKERFKHEGIDGEPGYLSPFGMVRGIGSLDFSGAMKHTYLQASRLLIEANLFSWPKAVVGIRSQLSNYDPENDKRIAQDIVATLGMSAHAIRIWFHVDPQSLIAETRQVVDQPADETRRLAPVGRSRRSNRSRTPQALPHGA